MFRRKTIKPPKEPKVHHTLIIFGILIMVMSVGVIVYNADAHISIFIGVIAAALMAVYLGYDWLFIESAMTEGVASALQSVIILIIVGILIGVWIASGVVPSMIYYGLKILSPSIFLVTTLLICSITSFTTGTAWGTISTLGLAFMAIAYGLNIPAPVAAGAIISGSYFGDKMSPLSDTTNLATAMTGTDMFTHIRFMILPTSIAYGISLILYAITGSHYGKGSMDMYVAEEMSKAISNTFVINPILLLPLAIVIFSIALKIRAIPGLTAGIISGAVLGFIFQGDKCSLGTLLNVGMYGYVCNSGVESVDQLLSTGGINNMMFAVSLIIIALMFGGIIEKTRLLEVLLKKILLIVKRPASLVLTTELTCVLCNIAMPDQYVSLVVPGRMYVDSYKRMKLHPKTLSNALESAGTVTSVLVPWNTCGAFIYATLGISSFQFLPYAYFNMLMPFVTVILAYMGFTIAKEDGSRKTPIGKI